MDTNSIIEAAQTAAPAVQSTAQRHWPAIAVAGMWLVRESHIWWPFLINNGGLKGIVSLVLTGKQTPTPQIPTAPAEPAKTN